MATAFFIAAMAALLGVVISLFAGMVLMSREGDKYRALSNKMMRMRVVLQAVAVGFLLLAWMAK